MPNKQHNPQHNEQQRSNQPAVSGLAKHWKLLATVLVVALVTTGIWAWQNDSAGNAASADAPATANDWVSQAKDKSLTDATGQNAHNATTPIDPKNMTPEQRAQHLAIAKKRLELAEHTYNSYQSSTKYPQASRPIAEHPDQVYPNKPIEDSHALRKGNGQVDASITVQTTQSRVFVGSKESVSFSVSAVDKSGNRLAVFVTRAIARAIPSKASGAAPQETMNFTDDGQQGDLRSGDGIYSGTITPSATSFGNFNGTVRVEVRFNVGDNAGTVNFDFIYTPDVPATWAGAGTGAGAATIREAQENGSLNFYMKANVIQAGRYLVNGRVDDASGKPLALVTFNDVLSAGNHEIRLQVFGKLIRDQQPTFPLTLRDVDGYLLKEDTDPDRAMMQRLIGTVHVSKKYVANSFSETEWDSEQRRRYLEELAKDVEQSKNEVGNLQKAGG